jgi:sulfide dehydrogenase cytochrome subunit
MTLMRVAQTGLAAGLLGILLFGGVASAGGVSRGALLAAHCESCHGMGGKGAAPMPAISGMDVADMVDIMKAFASKEESSTMMYRHAAGYSDDDLKAMAEYLKGK